MNDSENHFSRRKVLLMMAATSTSIALMNSRSCLANSRENDWRDNNWNQGDLSHLIPLVNHKQMLIKTSFRSPLKAAPYLRIDDKIVAGKMTDTLGRFWQFYATGLDANRRHELQIQEANGKPLTDPWPLKTFPHPDAKPERLRIMAYTCAGGNESLTTADGTPFFLNMAARHRLLERGLDFSPDVVIANGDHIYWDQETTRNKPASFKESWLKLFAEYGSLDPDLPVLGSANEPILKRIVDAQITYLYGVRLRSVPVYMLTDDHDMFENDEASDELITLPPDKHRLAAARTTQSLYYPEFLQDGHRPDSLQGSSRPDRIAGLSEVYGTLRYGRLFEALLYDTKRYSTIEGASAVMFPKDTEQWLAQRTAAEDTTHLMHIPSTPIGWSAGKWGEWYPDIRQRDGTLGKESPKPYWPSGWWSQHQRILQMLKNQRGRIPVISSGDLHAFSYGKIHSSGELDFSDNPIHSMCVGTLGSSGPGFPTQYRGIGAQVPSDMDVQELVEPIEKNGFTIIDVLPEKLVFQMFSWRPPEPVEKIDSLQPFFTYEINRAG